MPARTASMIRQLLSTALLTTILGCTAPANTNPAPTPPGPSATSGKKSAAQSTAQFTAAEESKIPYSSIVQYPSNWPAIVQQRDQLSHSPKTNNDE